MKGIKHTRETVTNGLWLQPAAIFARIGGTSQFLLRAGVAFLAMVFCIALVAAPMGVRAEYFSEHFNDGLVARQLLGLPCGDSGSDGNWDGFHNGSVYNVGGLSWSQAGYSNTGNDPAQGRACFQSYRPVSCPFPQALTGTVWVSVLAQHSANSNDTDLIMGGHFNNIEVLFGLEGAHGAPTRPYGQHGGVVVNGASVGGGGVHLLVAKFDINYNPSGYDRLQLWYMPDDLLNGEAGLGTPDVLVDGVDGFTSWRHLFLQFAPGNCIDAFRLSYDGSTPASLSEVLEPPCGNGVLDETERCDDGNTDPGDGCSPFCELENPYSQFVVSSTAKSGTSADIHDGVIAWLDIATNAGGDALAYRIKSDELIVGSVDPGPKPHIAIYDGVVTWMDSRPGTPGIYFRDTKTSDPEQRLPRAGGDQWAPRIYESNIVFMDIRSLDWDIFLHDISGSITDPSTQITSHSLDQDVPDIHGDYVVWRDKRTGTAQPWLRDLTTGTNSAILSDGVDHTSPRIWGDIVVYSDARTGTEELYGFNLGAGSEFPITSNGANIQGYDISNSWVVWADDRRGNADVYAYNLVSGVEIRVTDDADDERTPTTDGEYVVWLDFASDPPQLIYAPILAAFQCGDGVIDPGEDCDDGNVSDGDCCSSTCQYDSLGLACTDDSNVCTTDVCDGQGLCSHNNNSDPCDDNNACTLVDVCELGVCVGNFNLICNDGQVCTADSCDPAIGCVTVPQAGSCDDLDACTVGDTCSGGVCTGGSPLVCDDNELCTDDSCDPATGCIFVFNASPCDDGNACTLSDSCSGGACLGGSVANCDDGNGCTLDSCDPISGCQATPQSGSCNDGDACTVADQCVSGSCTGTPIGSLCESASELVAGGATVTTDTEFDGATADDPFEVSVTSPNPGVVEIVELQIPGGFVWDMTAPAATPANPLVFSFLFDVSLSVGLPTGIAIYKDGVLVGDCAAPTATADPDPCVSSRMLLPDGDLEIIVLTSTASEWRAMGFLGCPEFPGESCLTGGKSKILMRRPEQDARARVSWQLAKGQTFDQLDLGDPVGGSTYTMCVYDASAGSHRLVGTLAARSGSSWESRDPKGLRYRDRTATSDGVTKVTIRTGEPARTKLELSAKGASDSWPQPASPTALFSQDESLIVQLINNQTTTCWTTEFFASQTKKNTGEVFKARTP